MFFYIFFSNSYQQKVEVGNLTRKNYILYIYIYHLCIQYFKKISETLLCTQELQCPSDFSTASSSSVLDDSENLQKEISILESLYEAPLDTQK